MHTNLGKQKDFLNKEDNQPLGIFDSGLGGLSVVKEIIKTIPNENIVYFGDTARVPYGTKSEESIIKYSLENAKLLNTYNVKGIIMACNSSSACAYNSLIKKYSFPIINVIDPVVKHALKITEKKRIGIIGTNATINSGAYFNKIKNIDSNVEVYSKACPLLVPLIEEGWQEDDYVVHAVLDKYLSFFKNTDIDVLILGCTHYPFLKKKIKEAIEANTNSCVEVIDSPKPVAKEISNIFLKNKIKNNKIGYRKFLVSDYTENFENISRKFLGIETIKLEVVVTSDKK